MVTAYSYVGRHLPVAIVDSARNWAGALLGVGVISVDISIVNVAVPTLARQLHAGFSTLQWVLDAYIVAFAALLLATSVLARVYGPLTLLRAGIGAFALASLACAVSPSAPVLVAARAGQGIAASLIMPAALALTVRTTSGRSTSASLAVFSAVSGAATALGPSAGAILLDHFGWRAVFFVNLPLAALALLLLASTGRREPSASGRPGNLALAIAPPAAALVAVTYGLIAAGRDGWHAASVVPIAGGALLLVGVGVAQQRFRAMTLPGLAELRSRRVAVASVATLIMFAVVMGATFLAPIIMMGLYGYSLMHMAGVLSLTSIAMVLAAPVAGLALARVPARAVALAGLLAGAGALVFFARLGTNPGGVSVAAASVGFGVGVGIALPALSMCVVGVSRDNDSAADRGALFSTFRQVGLAFGIALFGTIAQHQVDLHLAAAGLRGHFSVFGAAPGAGSSGPACPSGALASGPGCVVARAVWQGYADTFTVAAVVCAVAGLVVFVGAASRRARRFDTADLVRAGYRTLRGEFRPERITDAGEQVVVSGRLRGVLRAAGQEIDVPFVHVWTIEDGRATRVELAPDC